MGLLSSVIRSTIICVVAIPTSVAISPVQAGAQDPVGRTVGVNGLELYYEEEGSGPPLLLLHWFGGCGTSWGPHRERLAEQYRLIVPDLRGHGRSSGPAGTFLHRDAASDVLVLLDSLGLDRVHAAGLSSGGMTLLHMATQQPQRFESLVLVGATSHFGEEARRIFAASQFDRMSDEELAEWRGCSVRGDAQTREVLDWFHALRNNYDDMNFTAPYLSTITAPTLIVHGDRDEFFPIDIAVDMYRAIPDARLWIVPGGGHIPIFGKREAAFQEQVLGFLGEAPGR